MPGVIVEAFSSALTQEVCTVVADTGTNNDAASS